VSGPLAGIKVVELGTLIAGPFAARLLAEFGAEVIKVEDPDGGDPLRRWRLAASVFGLTLVATSAGVLGRLPALSHALPSVSDGALALAWTPVRWPCHL